MKTKKNYIRKQYAPYLDEMESSSLKIYIEERVIEQIVWYDKKSTEKQNKFKCGSILNIALSACIPVLVLLSEYGLWIKIVVTAVSSLSTAINTVVVLCGYKDLWIQYRFNCEQLKSILHKFFLKSGEFCKAKDNPCLLKEILIDRCEKYMVEEYHAWALTTKENTVHEDRMP